MVRKRGCWRPDSISEMVCHRTPILAASSFCVRSRRVRSRRRRWLKDGSSTDRRISGFCPLDNRITTGHNPCIKRIRSGYVTVQDGRTARLEKARDLIDAKAYVVAAGGVYVYSDS